MSEVLPVRLGFTSFELECPPGIHEPGPGSFALAEYISICPGETLLDLGCGTGLFAVAAAKRGMREVWASDVDPAAAECARRNAALNHANVRVEVGDLFQPVGDRRFDVIVTNPPQTPAPEDALGPKFGGEDGLRFLEPILRQAPDHLTEGGKLLTMLISLADSRRFLKLLGERFHYSNVQQTSRTFTPEEFDGYRPGLFEFLSSRRRKGLAEFEEEGGRYVFWIRLYMAWLK